MAARKNQKAMESQIMESQIEEKAIDPIKEMESRAMALKAELENQKAMIKAAKLEAKRIEAEIKAARKAAPRHGEFDILADLIKEMGLQEGGFSKRELHLAYIAALGIEPENEYSDKAARKLASINAQLGARIMPKMMARGIKALESRAAIGKAGGREMRYFCIPE